MRFIDEHPGLAAVELILRVLGIPISTYHDWRTRAARPSTRAVSDALLLEEIKKIRAGHEFADTYGSPRIHLEPHRRGVHVSRKRVERLMRAAGLQGAFMRKGFTTGSTRQDPRHQAAPDLVNRDFSAPSPNRLWGGGPHPHPHRRGRCVAGLGTRRLLQPRRGLEDLRPGRHRPGARRAGVRLVEP